MFRNFFSKILPPSTLKELKLTVSKIQQKDNNNLWPFFFNPKSCSRLVRSKQQPLHDRIPSRAFDMFMFETTRIVCLVNTLQSTNVSIQSFSNKTYWLSLSFSQQ